MGHPADKLALYINQEDDGYAVVPTPDTFPTNYDLTEAYDIVLDLQQEYHTQKIGSLFYYTKPKVKGSKSGTLTFKHQLHGWSVTTPAAAPAALNPLAKLLKGAGMVQEYGGYGTENNLAVSTTTRVDLDDASGWSPGEMILVQTAASTYAMSAVMGVDTNDAYLSKALSAAPLAAGVSYGGLTFAPIPYGMPANYSLKMRVLGQNLEDSFILVGCRGVLKSITIEDGLPIAEFEFMFAGWSQSDHTIADVGVYPYPAPPPGDFGCVFSSSASFTWGGVTKVITNWESGASTAALHTSLEISSLTFNTNMALSPKKALNGGTTDSNIIELIQTQGGAATITYTPYFDKDHYTEASNNAAKTLLFVWPGPNPGTYCALFIPLAEVDASIGQGDTENIKTNEITKVCGIVQDSDGTMLEGAEATEWVNSAVRNSPWRFVQI